MMIAIYIFAAIGVFFTLAVLYLIIDDIAWSMKWRRLRREMDAANEREERKWREGKLAVDRECDRLWREIDDEHTRAGRRRP